MSEPVTTRAAYEAWAEDYDRDENATRDLDARVLRAAGLPLSEASVIEIGAGTGKNTVFLASHARHVLALDFTPAMLEYARRRCAGQSVDFREHDLRKPWPAESTSADLVVGNLVLEHISDLTPIFSEAWRVLRPAGTLYLCELHPYRQLRGATARFQEGDVHHKVEAYVHLTAEYVQTALKAGFTLVHLAEPSDAPSDPTALPRLLQLTFRKP